MRGREVHHLEGEANIILCGFRVDRHFCPPKKTCKVETQIDSYNLTLVIFGFSAHPEFESLKLTFGFILTPADVFCVWL